MLELRSVSRSAGREAIFERASLTFSPETPCAVLGLSSAARKGLIRLLSGADRPQDGVIRLNGREVGKSGAGAFISITRAGVPPSGQTVGKAIAAAHADRRPNEAELARLATLVRLGGKLDVRIKDLDLEQRLRLAIACARAAQPGAILLDAPFVDLSEETRVRLLGDLAAMLGGSDSVIVLAAATPDEALALGGAAVILHHGRVIQTGPVANVFAHPRDLVAALATSHPLLNTLKLAVADGGLRLNDRSTFEPPAGLVLPASGRCTLAFRPDDLHLVRPNEQAVRFAVRAAGEETVGGRRYVRLAFADTLWLAPQPGAVAELGMLLNAFVERGSLLVFDEAGEAVG